MRALHVAVGTNKGGHYFRYSFLLLLLVTAVIKTPERGVVGF